MPDRIPTYRSPYRVPGFRHIGTRSAEALYGQTPERMAANRFYASTPWLKIRAAKLRDNPLCEECEALGIVEPARHVHHIRDRKEYPDLALEWDNLQCLCIPCHNGKRGDDDEDVTSNDADSSVGIA